MFAPFVTIKAYFPATESRDTFGAEIRRPPCVTIEAYFPATESRDTLLFSRSLNFGGGRST